MSTFVLNGHFDAALGYAKATVTLAAIAADSSTYAARGPRACFVHGFSPAASNESHIRMMKCSTLFPTLDAEASISSVSPSRRTK
jgi:hypothetical protein